MTWFEALTRWEAVLGLLAAVSALGCIWQYLRAQRLARMLLVALARRHELERELVKARRRGEIALILLGQHRERGKGLADIAREAALLARLRLTTRAN